MQQSTNEELNEAKVRWGARILRLSRVLGRVDETSRIIDSGYSEIIQFTTLYHPDKLEEVVKERDKIRNTFEEFFETIALVMDDFSEVLKMLEEKRGG